LLLVLASAVILGSEFRGTHGPIFLSQIRLLLLCPNLRQPSSQESTLRTG
jgi:hypothetical protein